MARVKVGIVGCGVMGSFHIKNALALTNEAKLIGIFDANPDKLKEMAEKFSVIPYSTIEDLIKAEVDALIIAAPTSLHFEIAKLCLNKKIHLLVEKPLTMDAESCKELVDLADAKKRVLAVGMIERFNPAFSKALLLTKRDKILGIDIKRFSPFPERISDASVVWDM